MAFRFLHIADVHVDSPLRSLALRNSELAELIGNSTRRAFSKAVDICLEERVDALLIAGDLYDGDQTSMRTALFIGGELKRLDEQGIKTFAIRGNHDHLARITKELVLPDSVMVFGARAEVVAIETANVAVAIHGLSFAQARAPESLLPKFKRPIEGAVNIGLLHTSLGGAVGHDPYAPCSLKDLAVSGFRYWALGHIHARAVTMGATTIVMPGMPQGRDVNEAGPKSATLVTVADDGGITLEERRTSSAQFERVEIDVSRAKDWRDVARSIGVALSAAREAAVCEHLVARVMLTGSTALAWRMRRDADLLATDAQAHATSIGQTWLDKLEVVAVPGGSGPGTAGPFEELRRSMLDEVGHASATTQAVMAAIEEFRRQMPGELREFLGDSEEAVQALAQQLTRAGTEEVLARLSSVATEPG